MRQDGALSAAKSLVQADNSRCDSGSAGLSHDPPLLTRAGTVCDALHFFLVTPIALLLLHLKLAARAALPSAALCVGAQSHHLPIIPPVGSVSSILVGDGSRGGGVWYSFPLMSKQTIISE